MARRRYYYRRVVRPKQKWAINNVSCFINSDTTSAENIGSNGYFRFQNVVINGIDSVAAPASSPPPPVIKTGRFRLKGTLGVVFPETYSVTLFIAFVPQGFDLATGVLNNSPPGKSLLNNVFYHHPEWVIGWTRKDYSSTSQSNEISITSRLKRNLNSGDRIIVGYLAVSYSSTQTIGSNLLLFSGNLNYCCRAN